jgi:tRNA (guanine37-N1)-methyltransferase
MIHFDVITLFPQMFISPLGESILKRAQQNGLIKIGIHQLRDHTDDKHHVTDDTPYGGGAGMVMKVEPIVKSIEQLKRPGQTRVILMSPQGAMFSQGAAERLSACAHLILVCGRYEGVDERIQFFIDEELSIGDYILTGGELASLVIIDAVSRLVPGVVGEPTSVEEDTFSGSLLKYPQYTKPRSFRGLEVPPVLLGGDHQKIYRWRRAEALKKTWHKRPDLLRQASLTEEDKKLLQEVTPDNTMEISKNELH